MSQITKILIVEDEIIIARRLASGLEKLGYEIVDVVTSGEDAIESAIKTNPDLILMDIKLEGQIDGIEAAAEIKELCDIPVVYLTSYSDDKTLQRALHTGAFGYLIKPFKDRELRATIETAINKYREQIDFKQNLDKLTNINEGTSQYISMISHELRTPLTIILSSTELLRNYSQKWSLDKINKHFDRILIAVNNMNQMLEDLLTIGKIESGKLVLEPEPLDLVKLCSQLAENFQIASSDRHQIIFNNKNQNFNNYPNLDEKLVERILTNLLSNAIKYSPQGGKVILEVVSQPDLAIFRISDEGMGMPPEYQAKMFQRFERGSNVGNIKGTGLGLSIVKQLVELHGGNIIVESEVDIGTTVLVTLTSIQEYSSPI